MGRTTSVLLMVLAAAGLSVAQTDVRLVLPPDIYVAVGHETNIYFDNAVLVPRRGDVLFDVDCAKGRQDEDRWRFTPTAEDVGDHPLSLQVTDAEMNVLAEGATTVHVVPADAGAGASVSLLCVGDSLTHASVYPAELWSCFSNEGATTLRMVGTHHPLDSLPPEVVHEGYGGWTWEAFCTRWTEGDDVRAKSRFLRLEGDAPVLDFQTYCDQVNAGEGPDYITVLLGCNDTFSATEETIEERIDRMFSYSDMLLAEFQRVRADTKIGLLLLLPPAASQDAFGTNYQSGQTRWQYRRNQHRVIERMGEKYGGREEENLWLLASHLNVDTVNNYPARPEKANARSEAEVVRQTNGVHPAAEGYRQVADTIYGWLRWMLGR